MCLRLLSSIYSILIFLLPDLFSPERGISSSESSKSSSRPLVDSNWSVGVGAVLSRRKTLKSGALEFKWDCCFDSEFESGRCDEASPPRIPAEIWLSLFTNRRGKKEEEREKNVKIINPDSKYFLLWPLLFKAIIIFSSRPSQLNDIISLALIA